MEKNRYDTVLNVLFIGMAVLTLFNLYENILWLSVLLSVLFLAYIGFHIRYNREENTKSKRTFVLTLLILINFLLANTVIVIAEFVSLY
jgi:hypothetical protein